MSWWIESNPRDFTLGASVIELSNGGPENNSNTRCLRPVLTTIVAIESPDQPSMELPERVAAAASATATSQAHRGYDARLQDPTTHLTRHQLAYLFLHQAIPSMFIAGLLNLLIGYGIYATPRPPPGPPPTGSIPPFLFRPPLSLLADAAFTTIIQSVITWLCLVVLVNGALSRGVVAPHAPRGLLLLGREPRWRGARWFWMLDHYNRARGSSWSWSGPGRWGKGGRVGRWVGFWLGAVGRGLLVAVGAFGVMVGPMIGVCVAAGTRYEGDWVFLGRWDGAVFKAVYGGVLGLVLSPALAWMWMLRAGWIVNRHAVV